VTKRPSSVNNDPGFFYDQRRLLKYFALASILLMASIVWMIWKDFDRPWKHEQRAEMKWEARRMSFERFVLETVTQRMRAGFRRQRAAAGREVAAHKEEVRGLEARIKTARGRQYLADMDFKEQKQYTLEATYNVRKARSSADLALWNARLREATDKELRLKDELSRATKALDGLVAERKKLGGELDAVLAKERKNPELKRMEILTKGIARKRSYSPLREIPLLDFLAPPTKVEQVVLDALVDNYEFAMPKKVDRCGTCHVGAMRAGFDAARFPIESLPEKGGSERRSAIEQGLYRFVFGILDSVTPKIDRKDPFAYEKGLLRKVAIHHRTLQLIYLDYDKTTGEIGTDSKGRKILRRWSKSTKTGLWISGRKGFTLAARYLEVLQRMRPQWRTHPFFQDMVGDNSPHPYEKFGCSICHLGRGWSTDFGRAWHAPERRRVSDWMTAKRAAADGKHLPLDAAMGWEEAMRTGIDSVSLDAAGTRARVADQTVGWVTDRAQAAAWKALGRDETKLMSWAWPQLPGMLVQASCLKCHREGLYATPAEEYAKVRTGKPPENMPDMRPWEDNAAEENAAEASEATDRLFVPAQAKPYRPRHLERGMDNFLRFGCYGCHKLDPAVYPFMQTIRPKVGPPLDEIASKTTPEFLRQWVLNPKNFRPFTRMPRFWGLANNSRKHAFRFPDGHRGELDEIAWGRSEVYAIVEWILDESAKRARKLDAIDLGDADPARGERIVVGDATISDGQAKACIACHDIPVSEEALRYDVQALARWSSGVYGDAMGWSRRMSRRHGPSLAGIGSKVEPAWLYAWLKNPRSWWRHTNMPNLRLTDREAKDVTAYLMGLRNRKFENLETSDPIREDPAMLLQIAAELKVGEQRERAKTALEIVKGWSERKRTLYVGRKLVKQYGCFGCHRIEAYKTATPIGTELSDWGSKVIERLEFNDAPIEHTHFDFAYTKLRNPRIYDLGMPRVQKPYERLRMPRFGFSPEEARDLATFLVGLVSDPIPAKGRFHPDTRQSDIIRGRQIVRRYNCQGCHVIEGQGGDVWAAIAEDKAKWRPPNLIGQGLKTRPAWLFRFLKDPAFFARSGDARSGRIRPWHSIRMPTFGLSDEEARSLVRYFAALSRAPSSDFESPLPDSLTGTGTTYAQGRQLAWPAPDGSGKTIRRTAHNAIGEARSLLSAAQCLKCHAPDAAPENAAPSFRLTRQGRLRGRWIGPWLWNPGRLLPGTSMPAFFLEEDDAGREHPSAQLPQFFHASPDRQIEALRDYLRFHYRTEDR